MGRLATGRCAREAGSAPLARNSSTLRPAAGFPARRGASAQGGPNAAAGAERRRKVADPVLHAAGPPGSGRGLWRLVWLVRQPCVDGQLQLQRFQLLWLLLLLPGFGWWGPFSWRVPLRDCLPVQRPLKSFVLQLERHDLVHAGRAGRRLLRAGQPLRQREAPLLQQALLLPPLHLVLVLPDLRLQLQHRRLHLAQLLDNLRHGFLLLH